MRGLGGGGGNLLSPAALPFPCIFMFITYGDAIVDS